MIQTAGRVRSGFDEILSTGAAAAPLEYQQAPTAGRLEKRLIEHLRTYYRRDDLAGPLPLGALQPLALPFESYKLAFTPGLVAAQYGSRVTDALLGEGRYARTEGEPGWWVASGQVFYSPTPADPPAPELSHARAHFFLPHRYRDPFHTPTARDLRNRASGSDILASILTFVPEFNINLHFWGVGPSSKVAGGSKLSDAAKIGAEILRTVSKLGAGSGWHGLEIRFL